MLANWPVLAPQVILALAGGLNLLPGGLLAGGVPWACYGGWPWPPPWPPGSCALGGPARGVYGGLLDVGVYGRLFTGLLALVTLLALLFLRRYARERGLGGEELYGLVLLAALGMILTARGNTLAGLFPGPGAVVHLPVHPYRGAQGLGRVPWRRGSSTSSWARWPAPW